MAIETLWESIPARAFTADGQANGVVTLESTIQFRTKQRVILNALTLDPIRLQVKRVLSSTQMVLGPDNNNLNSRIDLSAYNLGLVPTIEAELQDKTSIPEKDQLNMTLEREPVNARRVFVVDDFGNAIGTTPENPIHTQLSTGSVNIDVENVDLSVQLTHFKKPDNTPADSVQVGDGVEILKINPDGSITVAFGGITGTLKTHRQAATITDISETTVATIPINTNNTAILKIKGDAQTMGTWRMYSNSIAPGNLLNVTKTSFSKRDAIMKFEQPELFNNGDSVLITFEAERYRSEFLGASSPTFVKMEGFTP